GVVIYRIQTDKGEIVIQTEDDDVEVVVKQGGKVVTIYDPKTKQKLVLSSGAYELELDGKPTGLKLDLDSVTLRRGDVKIAKIEREPPPPPGPAKPGEIRRFAEEGAGEWALLSPDGRFVLWPVREVDGDWDL